MGHFNSHCKKMAAVKDSQSRFHSIPTAIPFCYEEWGANLTALASYRDESLLNEGKVLCHECLWS